MHLPCLNLWSQTKFLLADKDVGIGRFYYKLSLFVVSECLSIPLYWNIFS